MTKPYGTGPKPRNYLDSGGYGDDVKRNLDLEAYHPHRVNLTKMIGYMHNFVAAGEGLDRVKKCLIYGKEDASFNPPKNRNFPENISAADSTNFMSVNSLIVHAIIGMATETSEMVEALVKTIQTGEPFDTVNFVEEMGDNLWYTMLGCIAMDAELNDVAWTNTRKLAIRYPDKFTAFAALNRNLGAERASLEGDVVEGNADRIDVV